MEKIANRILLKITPEVFCLIVDSTVAMDGTEGVECFCTLRQAHLFDELIVESKNQNQVMVEMLAGNFTQALKSGQLADSVVLRLTKRNGLACLTLEALVSLFSWIFFFSFLSLRAISSDPWNYTRCSRRTHSYPLSSRIR